MCTSLRLFNRKCRQILGFRRENKSRACTKDMAAEQRRARTIGFRTLYFCSKLMGPVAAQSLLFLIEMHRRIATPVFRREKRHTTFIFETKCLGAKTISFRNRRVRRHFQVKTEGREALPLTGLGQGHEFQTPWISHRAYRYYTCCMIAASPRDEVGP